MEDIKSVTVVSVSDTKQRIQEVIDREHNAFQADIKSLAIEFAAHNLPEQHAQSLEPSIETIRATYDKILNTNSLELSATVRSSLGALDIFAERQKLKELKIKANALNTQVEALEESCKKYVGKRTAKDHDKLKHVINLFTVGETVGYILSFLGMGDSFLLALVWGLLIGIAQSVFIKALVLFLRDGAGAHLPKVVKYLIGVAVLIIATGLGILRYISVKSDPTNVFGQSIYAPVIFILLSYFLISGMALFVHHYWPTTAEQEDMKKAVALDTELAQKVNDLIDCENQIKTCNEQCNLYAQVHTLLIQAAKDFYHRVNSHFKYSVGKFKNINRVSRTDNITPECFSYPVADLAIPNYDAWDSDEMDAKNIIGNP